MAHFPLFIELEKKRCLVIGGGPVAARKVKVLASFGAKVELVAPSFSEEFKEKEFQDDRIYRLTIQEVVKEEIDTKDWKQYSLVVAATGNHTLNHKIGLACTRQGVFFNSATSKEDSTFIFPAVVKKEGITIGITSEGKSPAVTRQIRSKVERCIPDQLELRLNELEQARELVKEKVLEQSLRKKIFYELIQIGMEQQKIITETVVNQVIDKVIREHENNN